jgi:ABC-type multidrug transport system fused ATPase/permease subunit
MTSFRSSFLFFFQIIGKNIYLSWVLLILSTLCEGVGISLFFPLLKNGTDGDDVISRAVAFSLAKLDLSYDVTLMLLMIIAVLFVRSLMAILQRWYNAWLMSSMNASLQKQILKGFFQANYNYYLSQRSGYIVNAVSRELPLISAAYKMFSAILASFVLAAVYLSIPLLLNPQATLYLLFFGTLIFLVMLPINKLLKKTSLQHSELSASMQNYVVQSLNFYKYLKSTNSFPIIYEKIVKKIKKTQRIQYLQNGPLEALPHFGVEYIGFLSIIGMIYFQAVTQGRDIESLLFVLFLLYRSISSLLSIQMQYRKFLTYSGSIGVYKNLKNGIVKNREFINENGKIADFEKSISIKNICFKYQGSNVQTLEDISLQINPNTTVGIAGESGSGKSTLMSLLTLTLHPNSGQILLGDEEINQFNVLDIRNKIGYVTQENIIFNDTINNNISLWENHSDKDKYNIINSSKKALAYEFIMEQPKKFETLLGDNGINLSGGQRQRITIARELFKDSKFIIFDEATSSLDSESEKEIRRSIHQLKGEKTIIIIAHRLFTLKECDVIYLFKKGKIIAYGTFNDLLVSSEEFKKMCATQNL